MKLLCVVLLRVLCDALLSRALAASFSEHLVKPVAFEQLLGAVRTLLESAPRKN